MSQHRAYRLRRDFILVGILLTSLSSQTAAQTLFPIQSCDEYVWRAKSQIEMSCPSHQGPRWSRNMADHRKWCNTKSPIERASEDAARRQALVACTGRVARVSIRSCEEYAARAMSQSDLQVSKSCGHTGPRWARSFAEHLAFCKRSPVALRESEDLERRNALAACRSGAPTPGAGAASAPATPELRAILAVHNAKRALHCVPPMTWSPELAARAQAWASQCRASAAGAPCHQSDCGTRTADGENLSFGARWTANAAGQKTWNPVGRTAEEAVEAWYCEIAAYDFNNPAIVGGTTTGCRPVNGHFTQVVWRSSTQLGCAMATCTFQGNTGTLWVCKYAPAGNLNTVQALRDNVPRVCR